MSEPARRFYKTAQAILRDSGFAVTLDQRMLKTPKGAPFATPTRALADAMAEEWSAQTEKIAPATMPITQLAFAAIDWTASSRDERAQYVASFGATDLLCHRAASPADLVARQSAAWNPLVAWGEEALGVHLPVVSGIVAATIAPAELTRLRAHALALDDFALTALSQAAGLAGSALIAFALVRGHIDGAQAYAAATLDDEFALERWGEDAEAHTRLDAVHTEFDALGRFVRALVA
jgi:chaperone required for assembly of F1-ATPase